MQLKHLFVPILKFLIRLGEAYEKLCKSWLEGVGLAERSLKDANFSEYSQPWHNLRGTDFSRCHLQNSNFEGVIGGFSFVRPVILLIIVGLSLAMTIQAAPYLESMFQPFSVMISATQELGFVFVFTQVSLFYLKISLALLYGETELPPHIVQSQPGPSIWSAKRQRGRGAEGQRGNPTDKSGGLYHVAEGISFSPLPLCPSAPLPFRSAINQGRTIILAFFPFWLGTGAYSSLLFAFSVLTELQLAGMMAIAIAMLFAVAAVVTFILAVGNAFVFRTSFVKANLESARLVRASLPGCNFSKSNLRSANLQGGDFRRCNFKQADLRFANFRGANLKGANLQHALLDGALGLEDA